MLAATSVLELALSSFAVCESLVYEAAALSRCFQAATELKPGSSISFAELAQEQLFMTSYGSMPSRLWLQDKLTWRIRLRPYQHRQTRFSAHCELSICKFEMEMPSKSCRWNHRYIMVLTGECNDLPA